MCRYRFPVFSSSFNNPDLGFVRLLLPLLGLSMGAGSLMLGGSQADRSVKLGLVPVLPWLVVPSVPCCRVAMVAALELRSPAIKKACVGNSETKDRSSKEFAQGVLKIEGGGVDRVHLMLPPGLGAGCCELIAMLRQVQDHKADASNSFAKSLGLLLQISVGSKCESGSKPCNIFPVYKGWNLSGTAQGFAASSPLTTNQFCIWLAAIDSYFFLLLQTWYNLVNLEKHITILDLRLLKIWLEKMICKNCPQPSPIPNRRGVLLVMQVNGNIWENDKFNQVDFGMPLFHIDQTEEVSIKSLNSCTIRSGNVIRVQFSFIMISGTLFYLPDDHLIEDVVLPPFGLCHQRWTTTSLSLIPRFNGGDPLRLSSVMVPQNLQLNPPQPRVHTPDRLSGEPPAGHQLVWSTMEALEDCRCSNIESVLSADERSLFGFIGNLWYKLQVFRSSLSFFHAVRLGTFDPRSMTCYRDMLYYEL